MTVKALIEDGWTRLPAGMAPISGDAIERLRAVEGPTVNLAHELLRDGWITRDPPEWVKDRVADWWLWERDDDSFIVPLAWVGDELIATTICYREREESERTQRERRRLQVAAEHRHAHRERKGARCAS